MSSQKELTARASKLLTISPTKEHAPYNIDREILEVVLELNDLGLATTGSCAGHGEGHGRLPHVVGGGFPKYPRGFIVFVRKLNTREVEHARKLLASRGLKGIRFETHRYAPTKIDEESVLQTAVRFNPMSS